MSHQADPITLHYQKGIKTGRDMMNAKIVPKKSAQSLALITLKRLEALKARALLKATPEMLGSWIPAIEEETKEVKGIVNNQELVKQYAREGMQVRGIGICQDKNLKGLTGIVRDRRDSELGIEWEKNIDGTNLDGKCKKGHGWTVPYNTLELILDTPLRVPTGAYTLAPGVTTHQKLGHRVRFSRDYEESVWDSQGRHEKIKLKQGEASGTLHSFAPHPKNAMLTIKPIAGFPNNGKLYQFRLDVLYNNLEASSLGQIEPQDAEQVVKEHVLSEFFPQTALEDKRAYRTIITMLAQRNFVFYGPPGGGKTTLAQDMVDIAEQQRCIFVVKGCKHNCNPFSVFDPTFAKVVPPCPRCMIHYCPEFKETGVFTQPAPDKVEVIVAKYNEGNGVEFLEGTVDLKRAHLVGFKLPRLDGTTTTEMEDESNPAGFHPGILVRTNNGIAHLGEMDKWRPSTYDGLLEKLEDERMKPEQLRYTMPTTGAIIGTANDHTKFLAALNDRLILLAIRYSDNVDARHAITRKAYHKKYTPVEAVDIGDVHTLPSFSLRQTPMPSIIERAVDALYIKMHNEFKGPAMNEITAGNRCKLEALDVARAKLLLDRVFHASTPEIADADYAVYGMQFAVCGRVQIASRNDEKAAKKEITEWIAQEFPGILKQEQDAWWCSVYRHIAVAKTQNQGIEAKFLEERKCYKEKPEQAWKPLQLIQGVYSPSATSAHKLARVDYPLIDYLWHNQDSLGTITAPQFIALMRYFMKSEEGCSCRIS